MYFETFLEASRMHPRGARVTLATFLALDSRGSGKGPKKEKGRSRGNAPGHCDRPIGPDIDDRSVSLELKRAESR